MSNHFKIEGDNQAALFRANLNALRHIFESDPNWAGGVMEIFGHFGFSKSMQKIRNSIWGCRTEDESDNYFTVRGTLDLCYRVEAVNGSISRIVPVGKLPTGLKVLIPLQLALACLFPVVLTPLVYAVRRRKIENWSRIHLPAVCQYLEIRGKQVLGQKHGGEVSNR